jgi:hypothetical protein
MSMLEIITSIVAIGAASISALLLYRNAEREQHRAREEFVRVLDEQHRIMEDAIRLRVFWMENARTELPEVESGKILRQYSLTLQELAAVRDKLEDQRVGNEKATVREAE